jgi:hypothetical protein
VKKGKILINNLPYPLFSKEGDKIKVSFVIPTFLKGGKGGLLI